MTEGGRTRRVQLPGRFRDLEALATEAGVTTAGVALDLARGEPGCWPISSGPTDGGEPEPLGEKRSLRELSQCLAP
jgi:hypothetical protein